MLALPLSGLLTTAHPLVTPTHPSSPGIADKSSLAHLSDGNRFRAAGGFRLNNQLLLVQNNHLILRARPALTLPHLPFTRSLQYLASAHYPWLKA